VDQEEKQSIGCQMSEKPEESFKDFGDMLDKSCNPFSVVEESKDAIAEMGNEEEGDRFSIHSAAPGKVTIGLQTNPIYFKKIEASAEF